MLEMKKLPREARGKESMSSRYFIYHRAVAELKREALLAIFLDKISNQLQPAINEAKVLLRDLEGLGGA